MAILSACLFVYLFVSQWRRDNDEKDGGDDGGTRGQYVNRRWKYVGYTTCLLLFFCCYLLSPACWLWRRDNDEEDGGDDDGTREQHVHRRRKYVGYTTYLLFIFVVISLLSPTCWLWQRDNDRGWWWRQRDERTTLPKKVRWLYCLSVVFVFCF